MIMFLCGIMTLIATMIVLIPLLIFFVPIFDKYIDWCSDKINKFRGGK
jgi:hypothetical protein